MRVDSCHEEPLATFEQIMRSNGFVRRKSPWVRQGLRQSIVLGRRRRYKRAQGQVETLGYIHVLLMGSIMGRVGFTCRTTAHKCAPGQTRTLVRVKLIEDLSKSIVNIPRQNVFQTLYT